MRGRENIVHAARRRPPAVAIRSVARAALAPLVLAAVLGAAPAAAAADGLELHTLSSRADMVSGGDAVLEVRVPGDADPSALRLRVGSSDRTADLAPVAGDPRRLRGVVDGLALGPNRAVASLPRGLRAELVLVNHPRTGPILSGPHQEPFVCRTEEAGLGAPTDDDCSAPSQVSYRYATTGGAFESVDDLSEVPDDVAQVTTTEGKTVPYVVEVERGTVNRAIYEIAVLVDPDRPGRPGDGFNGKLIYGFGGGCQAGYDQSDAETAGDRPQVANGYAFAVSSLNVFANRCSDSVSAETVSMVKERFVERYGPVRFTIGAGGSGGAMAQYMIDDNFPGLLDGSVVNNSFTDNAYGGNALLDCNVLERAFRAVDQPLTVAQRRAVKGLNLDVSCGRVFAAFGRNYFNPTFCRGLPSELVYHPLLNPRGARCTIWDGNVNVYGADPVTGIAPRPVDNIGVQYGLEALREGTISVDQFLDLNEAAGGLDRDGQETAHRTVADIGALRAAYERGQIISGGAGLSHTPMIDSRNGANETAAGQVHHIIQPLTARARIVAANGDAGTHVIWTSSPGRGGLEVMDQWLEAMEADDAPGSKRERALRAKPAEATDACFTAGGERIDEPATIRDGRCGALFPSHPLPRMRAGGPLASDVLKCRLRPVDPGEYGRPMTAGQVARLHAIFPDGVCDFTKPGVEQVLTRETWRVLPLSDAPDTVAPDTAIGTAPPNAGVDTDASFSFSADETGATFGCRVDRQEWAPCESPVRLPALDEGRHVLEVRATDQAGNTDPSAAKVQFWVGAPGRSGAPRGR